MSTNVAPPTTLFVFRQGLAHIFEAQRARTATFLGMDPHAPAPLVLFSTFTTSVSMFAAATISCSFTFGGIWFLAGSRFGGDDFWGIATISLAIMVLTLSVVAVFFSLKTLFGRFVRPTGPAVLDDVMRGCAGLSLMISLVCLVAQGLSQGPNLALTVSAWAVVVACLASLVAAVFSAPATVRGIQKVGFDRLSAHQKLQILSQRSTRREDIP